MKESWIMAHGGSGYRFEIRHIQKVIAGKSSRGENCDFERDLLKAWGKYFKDKHQDALAAMCEGKIQAPLAIKR